MQINYLLVSVLTAIFYLCLASCEPVSPSFSFLRLFQNKTIVNKWYCFLPFDPGMYNNDRLTAFDPGQPG